MNCLLPDDHEIQVVTQKRNIDQSSYQLDFNLSVAAQQSQGPSAPGGLPQSADRSINFAVLKTFFVHGVHHILTGYDHLLFVSALVLAATTLWDLVKVVTAFTLAHCMTLTLAAFNLVHLPGSVVEPLISASIVFVALQNIFWPARSRGPTRLAIAFVFGLFHGLGFAGGLLDLMHQMPREMVLLAILGFSLGVEAGHQMVLLPLFGLLKAARHSQRDAVMRTRLSMAFQRIGSAGISIAGAITWPSACWHMGDSRPRDAASIHSRDLILCNRVRRWVRDVGKCDRLRGIVQQNASNGFSFSTNLICCGHASRVVSADFRGDSVHPAWHGSYERGGLARGGAVFELRL